MWCVECTTVQRGSSVSIRWYNVVQSKYNRYDKFVYWFHFLPRGQTRQSIFAWNANNLRKLPGAEKCVSPRQELFWHLFLTRNLRGVCFASRINVQNRTTSATGRMTESIHGPENVDAEINPRFGRGFVSVSNFNISVSRERWRRWNTFKFFCSYHHVWK